MQFIDSTHDSLPYEDALVRAEAALSIAGIISRVSDERPVKSLLRGREDDIYWALTVTSSGGMFVNDDSLYIPQIVRYVRYGGFPVPSVDFIEKLIENKDRTYKSDRTCLFLTLAFGTDPSEPKRLGEILLSNPNIMNFYGINDLVEDGIVGLHDLSDTINSKNRYANPLKQRMTLMGDDALQLLEDSFIRFYTTAWEPELIKGLFADIREAKLQNSAVL